MKNFPYIPQILIDEIRKIYPDSCQDLSSLEELHKKQGQQELINKLQEISNKQDRDKKRG